MCMLILVPPPEYIVRVISNNKNITSTASSYRLHRKIRMWLVEAEVRIICVNSPSQCSGKQSSECDIFVDGYFVLYLWYLAYL